MRGIPGTSKKVILISRVFLIGVISAFMLIWLATLVAFVVYIIFTRVLVFIPSETLKLH